MSAFYNSKILVMSSKKGSLLFTFRPQLKHVWPKKKKKSYRIIGDTEQITGKMGKEKIIQKSNSKIDHMERIEIESKYLEITDKYRIYLA